MDDATVLALYKKPADSAAFDSYYSKHHAPLAKTLPGLQSYTVSKGLTDKDPYYQVAILKFASVDTIKSALGSTQGMAVVADLKNFAQAGVDIMVFENVPA
ncbi:MAG: EthD family reductase [Candidatus Eremiobacteraeota bacterium]|nr:EthD family reductase [Candidatus Eremiobacteraeota bacterium]